MTLVRANFNFLGDSPRIFSEFDVCRFLLKCDFFVMKF